MPGNGREGISSGAPPSGADCRAAAPCRTDGRPLAHAGPPPQAHAPPMGRAATRSAAPACGLHHPCRPTAQADAPPPMARQPTVCLQCLVPVTYPGCAPCRRADTDCRADGQHRPMQAHHPKLMRPHRWPGSPLCACSAWCWRRLPSCGSLPGWWPAFGPCRPAATVQPHPADRPPNATK